MAAAVGGANGHPRGPSGNGGGPENDKKPLLEDIMQLARLGDVEAVRTLFKTGKFSASHKDNEGITPLHWAAINNHYAMCKFLLEEGADVNAKGGEAVATAAMWAAQRQHYYVVNLLLQWGADPLLTDAQGYNILHLATFDGNIFLLILLLHQDIPVDTPDLQGHTCLMWAGYKGYPPVVDLFLRWGASVHARDDNGFTALHWALVKGSQQCISKLVEYGADRFAETNDGKTPATVAKEMRSQRFWSRALGEHCYDYNGNPKHFPVAALSFLVKPNILPRVYFCIPFFTLYIALYLLSTFAVYISIPVTVLFVYTSLWAGRRMLEWAPAELQHIQKTPFMAGVFASSLFHVGVRWLLVVGRQTWLKAPFLNTVFGVVYALCGYFYYLTMVGDPGYIPKAKSKSQQKSVIDDLLGLWKFDEQNFCTHCMARTPVRSKHCRRCRRCVAKHDHHCPWANNCIGVNNIRHFYLYILFLEIGIIIFLRLTALHLEQIDAPANPKCRIISGAVCDIFLRDTFSVLLGIWAALQMTWVTMLLFVQSVQITRATTTFEAMKGHHTHGPGEVITAVGTAGATSLEGAQLPPAPGGPNASSNPAPHSHRPRDGCFAQWKKLLGLDAFVATAQSSTSGTRSQRGNPFSRGIVTNCRDFWCDAAPIFRVRDNGAAMLDGEVVNYSRMYEPPPRMKARSGGSSSGRYQALDAEEMA